MAAHEISLSDDVFNMLRDHCVGVFRNGKMTKVDELIVEMMDYEEVPMHYPYHHFIVPAAIITLACIEFEEEESNVLAMLNLAVNRAKSVPGGFCGNCGACGSGVGAGMAISILTGASPLTEENWQWANELTGIALQHISTVPGPRCCKRTGFMALESAVPYINEKLSLHLELSEKITCKYSERNGQCKKEQCPYYKG